MERKHAAMNLVEKILAENIDDPAALFVFPTDIAASRWADSLLRLRGGGTIAMDKFIAWDTFKQNSIRSRVPDRNCIPAVLKKMFISALVAENAEECAAGRTPVFSSLIRPEWAEYSTSFVNWLAGILPQLGAWFKKVSGQSVDLHFAAKFSALPVSRGAALMGKLPPDDRDLYTLTLRYAQFLEHNRLFEPAWEKAPFDDTGKKCFIFFSESLTDFSEYREQLEASEQVNIVKSFSGEEPEGEVYFYSNSRSEITEAALYVAALHDNKNVPWDSVSVSVPDSEYYAPYLLREFENRSIPYVRQSGLPLASYPAGKFFKALSGCASADFSFASLTELLLNRHLPWKQGREITALIDFGIRNNCICSWSEKNGEGRINVWEDAFANPFYGIDAEIRKFFAGLKRRASAMRNAASFSEIRKQYFAFRSQFFDMDNCLSETDTILSRCISELMYLVETEKSFPDLRLPDPYAFFTAHLEETSYLAQQSSGGVAILPYRTAAPAPFDCHIILGASQEALTALFSPLAFLPRTRREKLGFGDEDASKAFITLHKLNSRLPAAFFCSEQTFSGYTIPHSALEAAQKPEQRYAGEPENEGKFASDLYRAESEFYASLRGNLRCNTHFPSIENENKNKNKDSSAVKADVIYYSQMKGFNAWQARRKSVLESGAVLPAAHPLIDHPLAQMIRERFSGGGEFPDKIGVSATSLKTYYECPYMWIFNRVLKLENVELETGLMADDISGQVFHAVLNLFFDELKMTGELIVSPSCLDEDGRQELKLPEKYSELLGKNIEAVFDSFPSLPKKTYQAMSMLTARLLTSQKDHFYEQLEKFLAVFISYFSGFRLVAAEASYQLQKDSYFLRGIVDCILEGPCDASSENKLLAIVDFKTKNTPLRSDYTGEEGLTDFQLPIYLRLAEYSLKKEVHTALFFSIVNANPAVLFGSIRDAIGGGSVPQKEKDTILYGSDEYKAIMIEFDEKAERFAVEIADIKSAGVPQYPEYSNHCIECEYNKVCRTLYKVCQGKKYGS